MHCMAELDRPLQITSKDRFRNDLTPHQPSAASHNTCVSRPSRSPGTSRYTPGELLTANVGWMPRNIKTVAAMKVPRAPPAAALPAPARVLRYTCSCLAGLQQSFRERTCPCERSCWRLCERTLLSLQAKTAVRPMVTFTHVFNQRAPEPNSFRKHTREHTQGRRHTHTRRKQSPTQQKTLMNNVHTTVAIITERVVGARVVKVKVCAVGRVPTPVTIFYHYTHN